MNSTHCGTCKFNYLIAIKIAYLKYSKVTLNTTYNKTLEHKGYKIGSLSTAFFQTIETRQVLIVSLRKRHY